MHKKWVKKCWMVHFINILNAELATILSLLHTDLIIREMD